MHKLLFDIKKELNLKCLIIKHEILETDKDIDILISKHDFLGINFPSNYKEIARSDYNKHIIYLRFDQFEKNFVKIDFIIDGLDYCNIVSIPIDRLMNSSMMIADGIFVPGYEYIYLDRLLGHLFFTWKRERTHSFLKKNIQPTNFILSELRQFNLGQEDLLDEKKLKSKLIRKKFHKYIIYQIKKKFFNLTHSRHKFVIVVMGIDGAGKSTLIEELVKQLSFIFNVKTTYMGWHDFYLWPIKIYRYFRYKNRDKKKRKIFIESIKKVGFIENIAVFIELYSRYLKSVRDRNSEIILFDRYFYDSIIRSKNHFMENILISFVPEPDLFLLLDAPDEVLYARKKEVSLESIKLLKEMIYSKDYLKPIVINTHENDIPACVKLANTHIFQNFNEKDQKEHKNFITLKKKYTVRNNIEAFSLFYSYFLFRPTIKINLFKKLFHIIDRSFFQILKLCFIFKINNLFPSKKSPDANFLIRRIGIGDWPCTIELHKNDSKYYIIKIYSNIISFEKEKCFLEKYYFNKSPIKLPEYEIIGSDRIRYEFIQTKNFATQIRSGYFSFPEIIDIYIKFCKHLDILYKDEITLIHGDLSPDNIYYYENGVYLIDYADSHIFDKDYDKYVLLKRLINDYYGVENEELIRKYASFDASKIEYFKIHYQHLTAIKHGIR